MADVLYRKYRSQTFNEVIGQETVVTILKESLIKDQVSHAYLFCGPRGTGKTSIARLLARAVNCKNFEKNKDVCNECENCLEVISGQAMDIIEMDAASNRGIEEIRSLKDNINYFPVSLKRKVYIIDEAHMLTKEAFNALLKTLEEPPAHVMFVMATTEPHKLPITILSRVQRYDLRLATKEELTQKLEKIVKQEEFSADKDLWDVVYTKSGGSYRDAESLLGKILSIKTDNHITKDDVFSILGIVSNEDLESIIDSIKKGEVTLTLDKIHQLNKFNGNIPAIVDQLLEYLRDKALDTAMKGENALEIAGIINLFIKIKKDFRDFNDKSLILELNLVNYFTERVQKTSQPIQQRAETIAQPAKVTKDDKKSIEPAVLKPTSVISSNTEDHKSMIMMNLQSESPRLKSIIMNSRIEIEGSTLKVYNQYKFNIGFITKDDSKQILLNAVKAFRPEIQEIAAHIIEQTSDESYNYDNTESQSTTDATKSEVKVKEVEDNSEIIENLF
jgi:DNA polymerase-3 subunit gamma/tau